MRPVVLALLLLLPCLAVDKISPGEYKTRRAALRKANGDAVTILIGRTEKSGGDLRSGFFQEENFYYLTGWSEPGAMLVLTPSTEALLIPRRDPEQEKWTGHKLAAEDKEAPSVTGFESVLASESFEANLPKWLEAGKKVYTLSPEIVKPLVPTRDVLDAKMPIARLRMKKSPAEIAMIQRATDVTIDGHFAAWKMLKPGISEYQVAAAMTNVYFSAGCERNSYAPIVGSGPNAATLHYSKNTRTIDSGELVLMDVAAECSMYASDITRTIPSGGKFSARQRELYDVVLGAQNAAIAAIKPGMMLGKTSPNSVHKIAADYIDSHGKDLHGNSLGKYFIHGLSHHVGLDVHDAYDPSVPLAAGMVITVEPGIYIPEEGIGIRIEDIVLVTETGAKLLSSRLPRDPQQIEKALASGASISLTR